LPVSYYQDHTPESIERAMRGNNCHSQRTHCKLFIYHRNMSVIANVHKWACDKKRASNSKLPVVNKFNLNVFLDEEDY